ncbi:MAG: hypothetical protein PW791_09175 [Neorhizobium sp.]|nr:hypothetical protein [Neorhizobium sp.]
MPLLDVSEVLDDPDFADNITVTRRTETVGSNGRPVVTEQLFPIVSAVVTQGNGDTLKQMPEGSTLEGVIVVHSRLGLVSETETTQPDVVTYLGRDYTVTQVNDWSRYGSGFTIGICRLKNLVGASP